MKLYDKKFLIYGNCMIRSFGQPGKLSVQKKVIILTSNFAKRCPFFSRHFFLV